MRKNRILRFVRQCHRISENFADTDGLVFAFGRVSVCGLKMGVSHHSQSITGILWMFVTGLCFVGVTALVKYLGSGMPPAQAAFLRYLLGLVFLVPMLRSILSARLRSVDHGTLALRGLLHGAGVLMWFYAMTRIPIAEVTAMNYLSPVFVTVGAALFLGERVALRRIAAIGIALLGVVAILRPGFREINPGHFAMLVTAITFSGSFLLAKVSVGRVGASVVVGGLSIWVTLVLAPFAWSVWIPPTFGQLAILFVVALLATVGHYTMSLAFAAAPVSVTQPVTFLQLVWAILIGTQIFGETLDLWVVAGGTMIIAAVTFISWREAVLNRRVVTPSPPATKL